MKHAINIFLSIFFIILSIGWIFILLSPYSPQSGVLFAIPLFLATITSIYETIKAFLN